LEKTRRSGKGSKRFLTEKKPSKGSQIKPTKKAKVEIIPRGRDRWREAQKRRRRKNIQAQS